MRKMEVSKKQTRAAWGDAITIIYSVTIDDAKVDGLAGEFESYGICIDIPECGESSAVRGITVNAASIGALADLISENLVTPCTLGDVVYDWLCCE